MLFAVLCIIAFILFIVHQFLDTFILSLKLDGPFAWPLIGNAMDFVDIKGMWKHLKRKSINENFFFFGMCLFQV